MKKILILFFMLGATISFAQNKNEAVIEIKTSAVCEMCKETLEKQMIFEKGVKESNLNVETKILRVVYNPKKTDPKTIRERITKTGYDADSLKAEPKAFLKLDECCKPGAHDDDI